MKILADGSTSRLYRKLVVEDKIAATTGGDYSGWGLDGGAISLYAVSGSGNGLDQIEAAVDGVLDEIRTNGVTELELERAKKSLLADYIYERPGQKSGRNLGRPRRQVQPERAHVLPTYSAPGNRVVPEVPGYCAKLSTGATLVWVSHRTAHERQARCEAGHARPDDPQDPRHLGPLHGYGVARRIEQTSGDRLASTTARSTPRSSSSSRKASSSPKWRESENNRRAKYY